MEAMDLVVRTGCFDWFHLLTSFTAYLIGYLNDLWRYRVNDSTWTWISGSNTHGQSGVYGQKGKASTENVPGARYGAVGWFDDTKRECWLFGGRGLGDNETIGENRLF